MSRMIPPPRPLTMARVTTHDVQAGRADGGEPAVDRVGEGPARIQGHQQRRFGFHSAGLPVCSMLVMPGLGRLPGGFRVDDGGDQAGLDVVDVT
jgi:hypothetical protein